MRILCFLLCFSIFLSAEVQRAQISQTYSYTANPEEYRIKIQGNQMIVEILSVPLSDFLLSNQPKSQIDIQSIKLNSGYTEFQNSERSLQTYSNFLYASPKPDSTKHLYELEFISAKAYKLKKARRVFMPQECKFILQKELVSLVDGKKDFVINLNNQHYFNKAIATKRLIECKK